MQLQRRAAFALEASRRFGHEQVQLLAAATESAKLKPLLMQLRAGADTDPLRCR